jgi:hypothetical protein
MVSLTSGELTADDAALKHHALHRDWFGLFAGNVGAAGPVFRRAATILEAADSHTVDAVRAAVAAAYEQERMAQAEATVLGVYGLSMQEFGATGAKRFAPEIFNKLCERIDSVSLGCDFLVCGFDQLDPNGYPHVFTVTDGVANDFFPTGWWAIGSGAINAIGVLAQWQHHWGSDLLTTTYRLLEAKFAAESALGVGRERTFVYIQRYRAPFILIDEETIHKIRNWWKAKMQIFPPESAELLKNAMLKFITEQPK